MSKTISCHRKYPITTNFLDTMLEHSVDIQEGETKLDAYRRGLRELDQIASELRKEANPHLSQENSAVSVQISGYEVPKSKLTTSSSTTPYEININHERMEIAIDNCQSLEQLKAWKSQNQTIPGKILTHYNTRMEILRIEENNKSMGKKNSQ